MPSDSKPRPPRQPSPRVIEHATEELAGRLRETLGPAIPVDANAADMLYLRAQVAFLTDPLFQPPDVFYPIVARAMSRPEFDRLVEVDRWFSLRDRVKSQAQHELVKRLSDKIIAAQVSEAEELSVLRGALLKLCLPTTDAQGELVWKVQPRSLEGAIRAFKDVSILLQLYRQTVLLGIEPLAPPVASEDVARGPFSDQEAGELASAILKRRFLKGGGD